jgi:hypothetical protein
MRPTNKLFLFALIIFLLFGTVPVVHALDKNVTCDESPQTGFIDQVNTEDTYNILLDVGQKLIIDVDAEKIGSLLDSFLRVSYSNGDEVGFSDTSDDVAPDADPQTKVSEDPYLIITADVDDTYTLAISAAVDGASAADKGSYTLLFECSDPSLPTPPEFTWPVVVPDLLGATGSNLGSLVNITPENVENPLPFPLGVGPIADIEYQFSTHKIFVAVNNFGNDDNSVSIIAIDPDSGAAIQTYNLVPEQGKVVPTVVALEAAENELYGVQIDDPSSERFSLVHVTFNDSDSTTTLTHVYSFEWPVWGLAYHSVDKVIYGVAWITNSSHLIKIHLEPELSVETATIPIVEIVDNTSQPVDVVALDFSHENVLFGVDLSGNLHEINHTTGQAVFIGVPIDEVSSLTSVVGAPPDVDPIKTICSSTLTSSASASSATAAPKLSRFKRKKNPLHRAIGLFKFKGLEGETVTLNAELEQQESADAAVEESSVSELKSSWLKYWKGKGRVFLGIRDSIPDVDFRVRKKDQLPLTMSATLPADGTYYVMLIRPLLRFYKTDYCLTLESDMPDSQAWESFDVAWPSDDSDDDTASTTTTAKTAAVESVDEQASGVNTDTDTDNNPGDSGDVDEGDSKDALNDDNNTAGADDEATGEDKSATEGASEDGQIINNTTITTDHPGDVVAEKPREPVDVDDSEEDTQSDESGGGDISETDDKESTEALTP